MTHNDKLGKSNMNFKNTRVTSCSGVLLRNGKAVCLAFTGGAAKPVDVSAHKSSETVSISQ